MSTTALPSREDVIAFAEAVRRRLDDLTPDEVDDLTEGLVADLSEQAEEDPEFRVPDADAYADELRAAAGLEPRDDTAPRRERYGQQLRREWRDLVFRVRQQPAIMTAIDFLQSIRPAWWVLRGVIVGMLLSMLLSGSPWPGFAGWVLTLGFVIVSVQWGRGRWLPWRWLRVLRIAVGIVAAIAILPLTFGVPAAIASNGYHAGFTDGASIENSGYGHSGLTLDGQRITNIFAYDADGAALNGVQLFDQDGQPLMTVTRDVSASSTVTDDFWVDDSVTAAYVTGDGRQLWNVFPLRTLLGSDTGEIDIPLDSAILPTAPFTVPIPLDQAVRADAVPSPLASTAPSAGTSTTPAPDASAVPSASPTEPPAEDSDAEPAPEPVPTPTPVPTP